MTESGSEEEKPGTKIRALDEKRILVVEDDADHGELLREILVERNAFVTLCTDAQSCLAQDLSRFDSILLDQNLPDSTGIDLLEKILHKHRLPVILVTGENDNELAVKAIQIGAADYICKVGDYLAAIPLAVQKNIEQYRLREENKRLGKELLQRVKEAEASNRAKDDFLSSVSHELRTPLNAILGLSEALQEEVYGPLTPKQAGSLRTIEQSGRKLLNKINDVIDLSRIGAGKIQLEIQDLNIELICEQSITVFRSRALKKSQKITFTADRLYETISADPKRLRQVLDNLLDNAVKFSPEGSDIRVDVNTLQEEAMVAISVWNEGTCIPADKMDHLFSPFVQLDGGLNRRYEGTGLGLALVKRLTELHGGKVEVESMEGKGTRFTIIFPLEFIEQG